MNIKKNLAQTRANFSLPYKKCPLSLSPATHPPSNFVCNYVCSTNYSIKHLDQSEWSVFSVILRMTLGVVAENHITRAILTNKLGDYLIHPTILQHLFLMLLLIAIMSISLPPATYIHNHVIGTQSPYTFP